jgi:microcystin-dependent protein
MTNYTETKYNFDGQYLTGIEGVNTGLIVPWGAASIPSGFLECNGAAVSQATYAALFAVIGYDYGNPGGGNFNLPNLTDKVALSNSPGKSLATTGGANTVASTGTIGGSTDGTALDASTIASHTHTLQASQSGGQNSGGYTNIYAPTDSVGGGSPHSHPITGTYAGNATSVLQPYLTLVYIIKT